jgi:hypothetical protein
MWFKGYLAGSLEDHVRLANAAAVVAEGMGVRGRHRL